jgi:quinone-modifying oxidoreductase, subunit QmoB
VADELLMGAYICKGCGIGDRLDCGQLEQTATRDGKAKYAKSHDFLCSAEGVAMIQADIDSGETNHVILGACSRRAKVEAFNFQNVSVARANLREGVIWVRPDNDDANETTQEMADDYIRMACAESKFQKLPAGSNEQNELNKNILVVGGGISGMTAAIEAADAGYPAVLVEKSAELGGVMGQLHRRVATTSPYAEPEDTTVADLIAKIEAASNITVHLNSTVTKTAGAPGRFDVDISTESGATSNVSIGAIVQASGMKQFDANKLTEFAYDKSENVITQLELEALAKEANGGPIKRKDGKEVQSVVFVQCAGQRSDKEGYLSYCSGFCCTASIKQAMYFKDANPDVDTVIMYDDLRTPGAGGEDFYRAGQKKGIIFTKSNVSTIDASGSDLTINFKDVILNEELSMPADLVVLATGQEPNSGPHPYALQEAKEAAEKAGEEIPTEVEVTVDSILNLDYRQGTDLPHLKHGFTDSHFICFPYETRRTGIYSAGPVRRPMDSLQSTIDATGAAMKAILEVENAAKGAAAHPRSGDLSYPQFRIEGCTQCKRCTVECPFGAINEDEKGFPSFNEARCRRCGTCMGACPVRVISFENYSVDTVGQQIKNVDMPDEFDEKPRVLVLACENDAYPALDMAAQNRLEYSAFTRVVPIRCLGSVNTIWLTDALNSGYDGIILMGCQKGDDYQCHFVKGSEIAHVRMSKIADTLETLNLEKERVATYEVAITDVTRTTELINDMAKTIEEIGMSPFKF